MGPSKIGEIKMTCSACETYRDGLRAKDLEPFSFKNAGQPGYMQPSSDVAERHQEGGCEPVRVDGQWTTACECSVTVEGQEEVQVCTEPVALAKREATFLVHVSEHFPHGFVTKDVALSLGWPLSEVLGAVATCVALGLVGEAAGAVNADYARTTLQLPQCLDDVLDAEEQDAARKSELPFEDLIIGSGEALAVMRAITDEHRKCFTEQELEAALRWASQVKFTSTLLDLVVQGWVGIQRSSLSTGDPRFIALDQDVGALAETPSKP